MRITNFNTFSINGILLIDKPSGISSNAVLKQVKYLFQAKKAGHTGTLDPLATGMLPICFGEATKFSQYLINSDKYYRVIARLGEQTDTSDSSGKIIKTNYVKISLDRLNSILEDFRGNIMQIPSMFSALKYKGRPLYKYARQGIKIARKARLINIYKLSLMKYKANDLELEIHCSKGTYIRTIIDDLGEKLGCGAHVIQLRRLNVSNFSMKNMVTIEKLKILITQAYKKNIPPLELLTSLLLPIDSGLLHFPEVNLKISDALYFKNGHQIDIKTSDEGLVRVTVGKERNFIGIGQIDDTRYLKPKRLIMNFPNVG